MSLPEDIVIDILSRLPIASRARSRCVSKQWQFLLSNTVQVKSLPKLLLSFGMDNEFLSIDHETRVENVYSPMDQGHSLWGHTVRAHSSCNGLVLIQKNCDLFLWNPLTKFFRKILTYDGFGNKTLDYLADLCFDYTSEEYKVVFVEKVFEYLDICSEENLFVATNGASSWEKIEKPYSFQNMYPGPFFKGYRHWFSKGTMSDREMALDDIRLPALIFYFDPHVNEFIELPMPQPNQNDTHTVLGLGVLYDCLCMTRENSRYFIRKIEILVMKDYGCGDSWNIMYVFLNLGACSIYDRVVPLYLTKEGELLVSIQIGRTGQSIKKYAANGNFIKDICFPRKSDYIDLILYEESWLKPNDSEILHEESDEESFDYGHYFAYDNYSKCNVLELEDSAVEGSQKKKSYKMMDNNSEYINIGAIRKGKRK